MLSQRTVIRPSGYPVQMSHATCLTMLESSFAFDVVIPKLAARASGGPSEVNARVSMVPSVASWLDQVLDSLMGYPLGCFEQACSVVLPCILTLNLLRRSEGLFAGLVSGLTGEGVTLAARAVSLLRKGASNMLKYMEPSGGFCWYPWRTGMHCLQANVQTTAHAILVLGEWQREQPGTFEAKVLELAGALLIERAGKNVLGWGWGYTTEERTDKPWLPTDETVTAHICWCLLQGGVAMSSPLHAAATDCLHRLADMCCGGPGPCVTNPCIVAQVSWCLLGLKDGAASARLLPLLATFQGSDGACRPIEPGTAQWKSWQTWTGSCGMSRVVETTAICAQVWLRAARLDAAVATSHDDRARQALRWLHCNHQSYHWYSTQGTTAVLRAIVDWAVAHPPPEPGAFVNWIVEVAVDGAIVAEMSSEANARKSHTAVEFGGSLCPLSSHRVEVRVKKGTGQAGGFLP